MKPNRLVFAGYTALGMCLLTLGARADFIVHTVTDNNGGAGYAVGSSGTFVIPQYSDPGGKPLLKVTLEVTGHSNGGSNIFDNEDLSGGTATVTIGTEIKVNGPLPGAGAQLIVRAHPRSSNSGAVAGDSDGLPADFIGADSIAVTGTPSTDVASAFKTAAFDIAPYQGGGTVTFDFSTLTDTGGSSTSTGGGANQVTFGDIRSDYVATITYEVVPEPGAMALLTAIAFSRLFKRSRAAR